MAIERRLTELAGPVGGKLHTARSRNDQVATDVALFTARRRAATARRASTALMRALVDAAERHLDWPLPGYTHLQRAQPVYLSHHLLAYFWMLARDRERFASPPRRPRRLPLGAGALAGVNFDTDRGMVADELGFARRRAELDRRRLQPRLRPGLPRRRRDLRDAPLAPGRRDRAVVQRGVRLRRAARRLVERARRSCPRRRTPTPAELLRAKAPRVVGAPRGAARRDARPAADLQQGPAGGQGAPLRRGRHARAVPRARPPG